MTKDELLNGVELLAMSQGFYGRLYKQMQDIDDETIERVAKQYDDMLQFIMDIEG